MHDRSPPPPAVMMQMIMGRFVSHVIGVAAKLGIADQLAAGPRSADALAQATGADASSVHRLLRALASLGVFAETEPGQFVNTPLSETLRDGPGSVRPMALFFNHAAHIQAWVELEHSVQTGMPGFVKAHGSTAWDYAVKHPDVGALFNDAMSSLSAQFGPAVVASYDFTSARRLVDIGGGHGQLLSAILATAPETRGVLFDLPHVVAGASGGDRIEVVGGDFFAEVPRGDLYVMKHILHDWSDERAIAILETIHRCAEPGAKLLLVETVLAPGNAPDMGKLIDIEMLVVTEGGRERSAGDFAKLFEAAGWSFQRVVPTPAPISLVEATRG